MFKAFVGNQPYVILFVPIIAIVKIIALNQYGLRPIGFLLGQKEKQDI